VVISIELRKQPSLGLPYLFRSYPVQSRSNGVYSPINSSREADNIPIWQVARATSAAPTYFKPMRIRGKDYIDGGLLNNNPSLEIWDEVRRVNGQPIKLLVSLGTGVPRKPKVEFFKPSPFGIFQSVRRLSRLIGASIDSQSAHHAMKSLMSAEKADYFRFDITLDSEAWALDSWRKSRRVAFKRLDDVTYKYLHQEEVLQQLRQCAKVLVEHSRIRSLDISAWKRFTLPKNSSKDQS